MSAARLADVTHLPVREAARQLGVSVNTYRKARRMLCQQTPAASVENLAGNSVA